jgi:hypothetical protein
MLTRHARRAILTATVTFGLIGLSILPAQASSKGTITGVVSDVQGRPVKGAIIDYHSLSGDHESTTTNSKGRYSLTVKAPVHSYFDVFSGPHYPLWTSGELSFAAGTTVNRNVSLPQTSPVTTLYGRVTDAKTGKPISRLQISSFIHEEDNDGNVYTDSDGWYAFAEYDGEGEGYAVLDGEFTYDLFTAATSKYAAVTYNEEDPSGAGPGIDVSAGQQIRFDFSVPRA